MFLTVDPPLTRQAFLLPREASQVIEPLYESNQVQIGHSCRLAELVVLGLTLSRTVRAFVNLPGQYTILY
jgi:hypothetical protein